MRFIDACGELEKAFPGGSFDLERWRGYAKSVSPELPEKLEADAAKYDFNRDVLPVVQAALRDTKGIELVRFSFEAVSRQVEKGFLQAFGETPRAGIILYLGLCGGAGWADELEGRPVVLLGLEKILELRWGGERDMLALIAHELGHLWHMQKGGCFEKGQSAGEKGLFQMYSEGVAMFCEQEACGDRDFYHQDRDGWLAWCREHEGEMKREYLRRLEKEESVQDFFGDWCSWQGKPDVGYYLGCRFVRRLMEKYALKEMLVLELPVLRQEFEAFVEGDAPCGPKRQTV